MKAWRCKPRRFVLFFPPFATASRALPQNDCGRFPPMCLMRPHYQFQPERKCMKKTGLAAVPAWSEEEDYVIEKHLEALLALRITDRSMPVSFNSGSPLSRTGANVRLRPARATRRKRAFSRRARGRESLRHHLRQPAGRARDGLPDRARD